MGAPCYRLYGAEISYFTAKVRPALRAKAVHFKQEGARFRDRLLTSTDRLGKLATIPVVVQTVNWANRTPATRALMEKALGVAKEAALPPYATRSFRKGFEKSLAWPVKNGQRTPGNELAFRRAPRTTTPQRHVPFTTLLRSVRDFGRQQRQVLGSQQ